ncbi:MAG: hypothetical protein LBK83_11230 [Treponema sp.]|jgi:DNA-binding transcriptional MerR regulator|nr:hypothetical protein [Treponema sp.]
MTIKEIAELCGVEVHTIRNWINKDDFLKENFTLRNHIREKLESGSPEHPSDYELGETLEIIGEGGKNKALASLLAENAVTKNALVVQSEAMAKIAKLAEKLPEMLERIDQLEARQEKFRGQTIEAVKGVKEDVKEIKARVDGAYKEVLDNATAHAAAEVKEYLLTSHKPSAHEAQLANLEHFLSLAVTVTGDRRHKIDVFRLYPQYTVGLANPIPRDAFVASVLLLRPELKCRGDVFSGIRFNY